MWFRLTASSVLAVLLAGGAAAQQQEPTSGRAFVDEAAKAAERAQQRDKDLVREMSEEATKAVEGTPSGAETVGSTAPPANTATRTPNLDKPDEPDADELVGQKIADRDGDPVGTVRDVMRDPAGNEAMVLVEETGGAVKGIILARILLAQGDADGYYVDLDREGIAELPSYRREGDRWTMLD
jgi:hypothetical protein